MFCTRWVACVGGLVGAAVVSTVAHAQGVTDCNAINTGAIGGTVSASIFNPPTQQTVGPVSLNVGDRLDFLVITNVNSATTFSITQTTGPGAQQTVRPITVATFGGQTFTASFVASATANTYRFLYFVENAGAEFRVTCTPAPSSGSNDAFSQYARAFLNARANLLLSSDPDRSRLARLNSAGTTSGSGFNAAQVTPLGQSNLGGPGRARIQPNTNPDGFQLWSEAHVGRFDDDLASADRSGDFEVLYVGGDLLISRSILIGALVQFDWMRDSSDALNGEIDGRGWMAGPYIGIQLDATWQFDARAAWGQSDNDITIAGGSGSFDTNRWLARGSLRGNWYDGPWRFTSISELAYIEEQQKQFTESGGAIIASQDVALGRFTFGPEIAYRFITGRTSFIEPQLSLQGLWNFDREENIVLGGVAGNPVDVAGRVEGGVMFGFDDGIAFRATGAYEGIGSDDFRAWSLRLWGSVPLGAP